MAGLQRILQRNLGHHSPMTTQTSVPLLPRSYLTTSQDAPTVSTGQQAKVPLNDINLFDEPISELGDHEPLVTANKANNAILPPETTITPTKWVVTGDSNPAEDILTSLLYPENGSGRASRDAPDQFNVKSVSRSLTDGPSKRMLDLSKSKKSPPRTSQPAVPSGRISAWAGSNPATIKQANSSKLPPSGYGYTPPSAISPKGSIRISGIAKAVEAQRQEDKLRRKEEKRRSQETVVDTPSSSSATAPTSQASPDDFLAREPSDSSDEGWIDAATYNARKGWRRPNVPHSVQDEAEDDEDTYVPEKRKPDMWSQQDVEVERMEQARIVTERTQKMQLLDFEVAPEPENIVPAWQPSTRSSNKHPASARSQRSSSSKYLQGIAKAKGAGSKIV